VQKKPKRQCSACIYDKSRADDGAGRRERARAYYERNKQRVREAIYARRHATPKAIATHRGRRAAAIAERADGTLTPSAIRALFAAAKTCAYCVAPMTSAGKTLDHVVPLARGGGHAATNVLVCCRACNTAKNALPFDTWVERLRQRHGDVAATRAVRAYRRLTGAPLGQSPLLLTFAAKVTHEHSGEVG
jgi:5-methylcytosine-specific restriction endonuclease McrA